VAAKPACLNRVQVIMTSVSFNFELWDGASKKPVIREIAWSHWISRFAVFPLLVFFLKTGFASFYQKPGFAHKT